MAVPSRWVSFCWGIIAGCMISVGVAAASEPSPLTLVGEHELEGSVQVGDRQVAIKLVDRDRNGVFDDPIDRLT